MMNSQKPYWMLLIDNIVNAIGLSLGVFFFYQFTFEADIAIYWKVLCGFGMCVASVCLLLTLVCICYPKLERDLSKRYD